MNRDDILATAQSLINGERADEYGDAKINFTRIAVGWSVILGRTVHAHEVALCMDWLKTCRLIQTPNSPDGWTDKAGYTALGGEIATD